MEQFPLLDKSFPFLKRILLWILVLLGIGTLAVLATSIIVKVGARSYIYDDTNMLPHTQTALIPGAAILYNGDLSPVLRDRVDAAISLYKSEKVAKILVSGDNSTIDHNEVNPVRNYLLKEGIPDEDIFLDHAGFDTYSSMYRARDVFLVSSIVIVSQSFHLPRAVFIARSLGIKAYGFNADNGSYSLKNYAREMLANVRAVLNLAFLRIPKYLGNTIPISIEKKVQQ